MTILRLLCFVGLHPRRGWEFVGDSWNPGLYVRVCVECGREMPDPRRELTPPKHTERCSVERRWNGGRCTCPTHQAAGTGGMTWGR